MIFSTKINFYFGFFLAIFIFGALFFVGSTIFAVTGSDPYPCYYTDDEGDHHVEYCDPEEGEYCDPEYGCMDYKECPCNDGSTFECTHDQECNSVTCVCGDGCGEKKQSCSLDDGGQICCTFDQLCPEKTGDDCINQEPPEDCESAGGYTCGNEWCECDDMCQLDTKECIQECEIPTDCDPPFICIGHLCKLSDCTDSDGGLNPTVPGYAFSIRNGDSIFPKLLEDRCPGADAWVLNRRYIIEARCVNGVLGNKNVACPPQTRCVMDNEIFDYGTGQYVDVGHCGASECIDPDEGKPLGGRWEPPSEVKNMIDGILRPAYDNSTPDKNDTIAPMPDKCDGTGLNISEAYCSSAYGARYMFKNCSPGVCASGQCVME